MRHAPTAMHMEADGKDTLSENPTRSPRRGADERLRRAWGGLSG